MELTGFFISDKSFGLYAALHLRSDEFSISYYSTDKVLNMVSSTVNKPSRYRRLEALIKMAAEKIDNCPDFMLDEYLTEHHIVDLLTF